jgi:hypothetical protein
VSISLALD